MELMLMQGMAGNGTATDPRLNAILERMRTTQGAPVDYATVWGLSDLYDWLILEKGVAPHDRLGGAATPMFWAMLEWSGKERGIVAAFLNAKYEVDMNLLPDPNMTWWERIGAGVGGIIEAPATIINQATAPLSDEIKEGLKYAAFGLGGLGILALALRFAK